MNPSPTSTTDMISLALGLLQQQAALYDRLMGLAAKQRALVSGDDPQPLLKVLARRRQLAAELEVLSKRMAPLRAQWSSLRAAMTDVQGDEAEALIARVNDRLRRLLASDEEDAQRLRALRQRVGGDLSALRTAQQAVHAYRYAAGGPAPLERMLEKS